MIPLIAQPDGIRGYFFSIQLHLPSEFIFKAEPLYRTCFLHFLQIYDVYG